MNYGNGLFLQLEGPKATANSLNFWLQLFNDVHVTGQNAVDITSF